MSRKKAGMSANAKWGIAFLIEIVVMFFMVVGYLFFYANRKLDNINRPTNWDDSKENLDINEDANEAQKGYRTIALFGIDSRSTTSMAEGNRSDSIIIASINNAKIFKQIKNEYGSFYNYLKQFTNGNRYIEVDQVSSELSDKISEDLVKRKMKFVGTKIIYSFLQAIGIIYSHDKECYLYKESITNE